MVSIVASHSVPSTKTCKITIQMPTVVSESPSSPVVCNQGEALSRQPSLNFGEPSPLLASSVDTSLGEFDLSYLAENLDSLADLDSLLAESQAELDTTSATDTSSEVQSVASPYTPSNTSEIALPSKTALDLLVVPKQPLGFDSDLLSIEDDPYSRLSSSPLQFLEGSATGHLLSDSGYSSDPSNLGSPHRHSSLFGEDQDIWGESFTDLFPSLI